MKGESKAQLTETSCLCRAELNLGIKYDKSIAEARRLNQTFDLI